LTSRGIPTHRGIEGTGQALQLDSPAVAVVGPGSQAHRVIFIDLARALAVILMLYGHTVSAVLASEYRTGLWFEIWTFQRGLTSSLFFLLSGFAFSIATTRHWTTHLRPGAPLLKRLGRFARFVVLGYALHFPVARLGDLALVTDERWQSFLVVDVLQLIGVSFVGVQLLVLAVRSRRLFMATVFVLAALVVAATPAIWATDWTGHLHPAVAAYLTPRGGSLFPLFPWSAFILTGAGLGQLYARWGAAHLRAYSIRALLVPGMFLMAAATGVRAVSAFPANDPGALVPTEVALRVGACLVALALIARVGARIARLPHLFGAVAQESLLIYFVHLCIVYGSVWNPGLAQIYGSTLGPWPTLAWVAILLAGMAALAWYWNGLKHSHPVAARWTAAVTGSLLLVDLL
jgi:uncharacterized membrane protein